MPTYTTKMYSIAFKRQLVKEFEEGHWKSYSEAQRFYGIGGASTVSRWLTLYGSEAFQTKRKVVRVETRDEQDLVSQLKQEVQELKDALSATSLERYQYQAYFELACQEGGITDCEKLKKKLELRQHS